MNDRSNLSKQLIACNGVRLSETQLAQLDLYHQLLLEWNAKVNLISRNDEGNIWTNHILHSLSILFQMTFPDGVRVADVGSGGGLPGIPLSIAMPRAHFVLIESIRKKSIALEDMVCRLGLANVRVLNARAEDVAGRKEYGNSFDIVVARAVASLEELIEWSSPLACKQTNQTVEHRIAKPHPELHSLPILLALKGGDIEQEIAKAPQKSMFRYARSYPVQFDGIDQTGLVNKHIVIVGL